VVASHGGSGQSLIGNILFELGLNYVDAYTEILSADGRAMVATTHESYRSHLAAQHDKDRGNGVRTLWPRFVKTHHPPSVFATATIGGVWLLVRDPRDAVYASYQWRAGFAEEEWDKVPGSFAEWLAGSGDFSASPVSDWSAFYTAWSDQARQVDRSEVLRFEDLKTRPTEVVGGVLDRLGMRLPAAEIARAADASSFPRMREHEDRATDPDRPRVIRAGRVAGWTAWMTPELARFFADPQLWEVAARYGYCESEPV
jgi:hypothetical protein